MLGVPADDAPTSDVGAPLSGGGRPARPGAGLGRSAASPVPGSSARYLDPIGVLWAALLTALVLLPVWLRPGFVLTYDLVAVPQQRLLPWMWGGAEAPPRAVPMDVYVAVLDNVIPGAVLQRLLLAAALFGSALGMVWLCARLGRLGQLVAATSYTWSVYVFERLAIGHLGYLLPYAALPWAIGLCVRARQGGERAAAGIVLVVAVGAWTPTGGVILAAVAAALLTWPGSALSRRATLWVLVGMAATQLVWVVPGILTTATPSAAGAVFELRADSLRGAVGQILQGGGIWSDRFAPGSRQGVLGVVAAALVVVALLVGLPPLARALHGALAPLLLVAAVLAGWVLLTAVPAAAGVVAWAESLPGGGLLRDAQKWLAPWWLLCSLALGAAAHRLWQRLASSDARVLAHGLVLVPLVLLPDLAWGAMGRLDPARYPAGWDAVSTALADADDGSDVVSLPPSTFRRYAWNHDRVVLDPGPRYLPRTVVTDSRLAVAGSVADSPVVVPGDDPRSTAVLAALGAQDPLSALRRAGIGWVLVQDDQQAVPGTAGTPGLAEAPVVVSGDGLTLRRLVGPVTAYSPRSPVPFLVAWGALGAAVGIALGVVVRTARFREQFPGETTRGCP